MDEAEKLDQLLKAMESNPYVTSQAVAQMRQRAVSAQMSAMQAQIQRDAQLQQQQANYSNLANQAMQQINQSLHPPYQVKPEDIFNEAYSGGADTYRKNEEEEKQKTIRKENAKILSKILRDELQTRKA